MGTSAPHRQDHIRLATAQHDKRNQVVDVSESVAHPHRQQEIPRRQTDMNRIPRGSLRGFHEEKSTGFGIAVIVIWNCWIPLLSADFFQGVPWLHEISRFRRQYASEVNYNMV